MCGELAERLLGQLHAYHPFFVFHDEKHSESIPMSLKHLLGALKGAGFTHAAYCVLECTAYLHDAGMAWSLLRWGELGVGYSYVLKGVADEKLEEYAEKIKDEFFAYSFLELPLNWGSVIPLPPLGRRHSR